MRKFIIALHLVVSVYVAVLFVHSFVVMHGWLAWLACSSMPAITGYMAYKALTTTNEVARE